jgi:mannose-6-phosphate isomerase-like protein (cupin superfamily)
VQTTEHERIKIIPIELKRTATIAFGRFFSNSSFSLPLKRVPACPTLDPVGHSCRLYCPLVRHPQVALLGHDEAFASKSMKPIQGYHLIKPEDLSWQTSRMMQIPNADFLERTGSENLSARLWRLPPGSANTLHKHIRQEEFYFVLEGTGRMRVGNETLTVPKHGGVLVGPDQLRQVFNDTDTEVLWLIVGAPEELEFLPGAKTPPDLSLIYPEDPKQLPPELADVEWPPKT